MEKGLTTKTQGMGSYIPDAESVTAVVEVKARLSSGRSLRDALVQLVGVLAESQEKRRAYLLLIDPQVGLPNLHAVWRRFQAALRPEIASRLFVHVFRDGRFEENSVNNLPRADRELLDQCIAEAAEEAFPLPRPNTKSEVFRAMLHQWILGQGAMTSKWLAGAVGCNYRTVAATIEHLGRAVKRHSDRRVQLKYFPKDEWSKFLAVASTARATMNYVDRSDQPRSPESLVWRLHRLDRSDIAIGGVLGAKRYHPDLDIVGTPRLDLCVHCAGKYVDLDFVQRLDPQVLQVGVRQGRAHDLLRLCGAPGPRHFDLRVLDRLLVDPRRVGIRRKSDEVSVCSRGCSHKGYFE